MKPYSDRRECKCYSCKKFTARKPRKSAARQKIKKEIRKQK